MKLLLKITNCTLSVLYVQYFMLFKKKKSEAEVTATAFLILHSFLLQNTIISRKILQIVWMIASKQNVH